MKIRFGSVQISSVPFKRPSESALSTRFETIQGKWSEGVFFLLFPE